MQAKEEWKKKETGFYGIFYLPYVVRVIDRRNIIEKHPQNGDTFLKL